MEVLIARHPDFILTIENDNLVKLWEKARNRIGQDGLLSKWSWTGNETEVILYNEENITIENGGKEQAIFFDNTDYPIWVEFNIPVKRANISFPGRIQKTQGSMAKETFAFRERSRMLTGFINYGNEIGQSYLHLKYILPDGELREWKLRFDVLSSKLNYHEHWRVIMDDIEREYRMLSLDFLKRTFHSFQPDSSNGDSSDIIWWNIFNSLQKSFIQAVRKIIDRPRHRLSDMEEFLRVEKVNKFTPQLEEEFAQHKLEENHLYRSRIPFHSHDTLENRFLRHAINTINEKYNRLFIRIKKSVTLSSEILNDMENTALELKKMSRHPFFRTVGFFKGFTQESQVLQKASGYSQVYRSWILLNKSFSLNEGLFNLETKDIATLYEIWCYIQIKNIVEKQLGEGIDVDNRSRLELGSLFTYNLTKGQNSSIIFKKDEIELAELIYNPQQDFVSNSQLGITGLVSPTAPQRPDIVLQLTKDDIEAGMKMTYLFDAKYRIDTKIDGVDTPPEDAINQMHRYRDAIYYDQKGDGKKLKKEVIGGYILFPGSGQHDKILRSNFFDSIKKVNIGAFPLRPNDIENREFLEDFISKIIESQAEELLESDNVIAQKGLKYVKQDSLVKVPKVFIGHIDENSPLIDMYRSREAQIFFSSPITDSSLDIQSIGWVAPIFKEKNGEDNIIDGYYKVKSINVITNEDSLAPFEYRNRVCLKFELDEFIPLEDTYLVSKSVAQRFNRCEAVNYRSFNSLCEHLGTKR